MQVDPKNGAIQKTSLLFESQDLVQERVVWSAISKSGNSTANEEERIQFPHSGYLKKSPRVIMDMASLQATDKFLLF